MKDEKTFNLLIEISRLLQKYGSDTFKELANYLNQPESIGNVTVILEQTARAGKSMKSSSKPKLPQDRKVTSIPKIIITLEKSDPVKAKLLTKFHQKLVKKSILPTFKELKFFSIDNGFSEIKATSRDKALSPLVTDLSKRTTEQIRTIVEGVSFSKESGDRTLEGWADIILKNRNINGNG